MHFFTQVVLLSFTILLFAIRSKSIYRAFSEMLARIPFLEAKLLLGHKSHARVNLPRRGHVAHSQAFLGGLEPLYKRDPSNVYDCEPVVTKQK